MEVDGPEPGTELNTGEAVTPRQAELLRLPGFVDVRVVYDEEGDPRGIEATLGS